MNNIKRTFKRTRVSWSKKGVSLTLLNRHPWAHSQFWKSTRLPLFLSFFFQLVDVPLINSEGKMLLPPAELGKGCPSPVYANPRQVLRILKRREAKKRLARSGKLKNRAKRVCMAANFSFIPERGDWTYCSNLDSIIMLINWWLRSDDRIHTQYCLKG